MAKTSASRTSWTGPLRAIAVGVGVEVCGDETPQVVRISSPQGLRLASPSSPASLTSKQKFARATLNLQKALNFLPFMVLLTSFDGFWLSFGA